MKMILLILLLAIIAYYAYPVYKATKAAAEIEKATVPFEQHPGHPTMRILVAGDSTAVGTGASRPEESTAGRLGAHFPTADVSNISKNGLRIAELESRLTVLEENYDLIVVQIGANDIVRFTPLSRVEERLASILNIATTHSKSVIVITSGNIGLSPVFNWPLSDLLSHRTRQVREIFMQKILAYPTASYADLYKEREDDIFIKDVPKYYAEDRFHPSSEGYKVWFGEISKNF